jgi:hypothetical protein
LKRRKDGDGRLHRIALLVLAGNGPGLGGHDPREHINDLTGWKRLGEEGNAGPRGRRGRFDVPSVEDKGKVTSREPVLARGRGSHSDAASMTSQRR